MFHCLGWLPKVRPRRLTLGSGLAARRSEGPRDEAALPLGPLLGKRSDGDDRRRGGSGLEHHGSGHRRGPRNRLRRRLGRVVAAVGSSTRTYDSSSYSGRRRWRQRWSAGAARARAARASARRPRRAPTRRTRAPRSATTRSARGRPRSRQRRARRPRGETAGPVDGTCSHPNPRAAIGAEAPAALRDAPAPSRPPPRRRLASPPGASAAFQLAQRVDPMSLEANRDRRPCCLLLGGDRPRAAPRPSDRRLELHRSSNCGSNSSDARVRPRGSRARRARRRAAPPGAPATRPRSARRRRGAREAGSPAMAARAASAAGNDVRGT